jgi:hypothetical protein
MNNGEIILYQPDNFISIEVRMEAETVWLNLNQMAMLFDRDKSVISRHIHNVYSEGELKKEATVAKNATVQIENGRQVMRQIEYYNLDVIISVGYRVKSLRGTQFRQWATGVLKEYLLKGYAVNNRIEQLEQRVARTEEKIDFFVRTELPPVEGVFYNGQIFDAYVFATDLIKSAKKSITLIDNYIDESVLLMLSKRKAKVCATVITRSDSKVSQLDIEKHNAQYSPIEVKFCDTIHDRFLIIDNEVYHLGASLKDLGKKLFAFSKLEMSAETILQMIVLEEMGDASGHSIA